MEKRSPCATSACTRTSLRSRLACRRAPARQPPQRSAHRIQYVRFLRQIGESETATAYLEKVIDEASDYQAFLASGLINNPGDNWTTVLNDYPETARLANVLSI